MPSPARVFKSRRYTEAQSFNAMIVLAVTLNQIIRFFTRFLRTHALRPFLVTWLNLSMLVGTTAPNMFEKQGDSAIVEGAVKALSNPLIWKPSQRRPVLFGAQLDQLFEKKPQRRQVRKRLIFYDTAGYSLLFPIGARRRDVVWRLE